MVTSYSRCWATHVGYDIFLKAVISSAYVSTAPMESKLSNTAKNGYPPQYSLEVFQKVMGQVENSEENN